VPAMNTSRDQVEAGPRVGTPPPPSRWGVGLPTALVTLPWAGGAIAAHLVWHPLFAVEGLLWGVLAGAGAAMLLVGVGLYAWCVRVIRRAWRRGELATTGPYVRCRHPRYATWMFLMVPGVCLMSGSWLLLTVPVVMYAATRLLVGREEQELEARFGETWRAYRARTGRFLPRRANAPAKFTRRSTKGEGGAGG